MWADNYINQLKVKEFISFRPRGNSMSGIIESGQLVTLTSDTNNLKIGDIVLCYVAKNQYLHKITSITGHRYQISNNRGKVNGWTSIEKIYGKVIEIS